MDKKKLFFLVPIITITIFPQSVFSLTFSNETSNAGLNGYPPSRCAAWLDFDRDGFLDLIVGSAEGANRLFKNNGNGTFADVTETAAIPSTLGVWGINFADIDNDSFPDIYFSTRAPDTSSAGRNVLLKNTGLGNFENISDSSRTNVYGGGVAACFAPFNKDEFIDLFVPNQYYPTTQFPNLLINMGGCVFADQTSENNLHSRDWWDVPIVFDFDNDGVLELFCTQDYHGNALFDRSNYHEPFENISDSMNFQTACGYGVTIGDVNGDGWFDLYITNWHDYYDKLFIFDSTSNAYHDFTSSWHAPGNTWTSSPQFADFDNDGFEDLFVSSGSCGNKLYKNIDGSNFQDISVQSGVGDHNYNWGACLGDYDNNGFLDIYLPQYIHTSNGGCLYLNDGNDNYWIKVRLQGILSNRDGIGAKLILTTYFNSQIRQVLGGSGFGSQNSLIQHFGLGQCSMIEKLVIIWPSGVIDNYENLAANQEILAIEGIAVNATDEMPPNPGSFLIESVYPNPFNSNTIIKIKINYYTQLDIKIVDLLGRTVRNLANLTPEVEELELTWNGMDNGGRFINSGYIFVLFLREVNLIRLKSPI